MDDPTGDIATRAIDAALQKVQGWVCFGNGLPTLTVYLSSVKPI
jgi:hypothetical protein